MSERRPLGGLIAALEGRDLLRQVLPATIGSGGPSRATGAGAVGPVTGAERSGAPATVAIAGIDYDSRRVQPGALFVAVPGAQADGHEFAAAAVRAGAVAVIVERPLPGLAVPQIVVRSARPALALAAAWSSGFPSRELGVVGVTGTDGKTTTCYLLRAVLEGVGRPTGLLTTVEIIVGERELGNPARSTTPEAPEIQDHLAAMVAAGDRWAVIETSSHGLAQDRVAEVAYDVAVLTNVTLEHLEFHRTLEAYRAAKRHLFELLAPGPANPEKGFGKHAVINRDDAQAGSFESVARAAGATLLTYGAADDADVRLTGLLEDGHGLRLAYRTRRGRREAALRLGGRFNASNALAAIAVGEALGLDPGAVEAALGAVRRVPGRMERIEAGQPFGTIVDYAHTPEALAQVLDELAPVAGAAGGGLICVFGSAGERDAVKRPLMGRVAGERCRLVVLTDEDPRGEDREAILEEIAEGARAAGRRDGQDLRLVPDRREAIGLALEAARPGDVVLFAGKGHEKTIEGPGDVRPWDEAAEVRRALAELGWTADR